MFLASAMRRDRYGRLPEIIPAAYRPFLQQIDRYPGRKRLPRRLFRSPYGVFKLLPGEALFPAMEAVDVPT